MKDQQKDREINAEEVKKAILEEKRAIKPVPEDIVKRVKEKAGQTQEGEA